MKKPREVPASRGFFLGGRKLRPPLLGVKKPAQGGHKKNRPKAVCVQDINSLASLMISIVCLSCGIKVSVSSLFDLFCRKDSISANKTVVAGIISINPVCQFLENSS